MDLFGDGLLFLFGKCLGMELLSDVKVYVLLLMNIWVSEAFAIINSVVMNSSVQRYIFFSLFLLVFLWDRSRISGTKGKRRFSFARRCQMPFHRDCAILHSYQQCKKISVSP